MHKLEYPLSGRIGVFTSVEQSLLCTVALILSLRGVKSRVLRGKAISTVSRKQTDWFVDGDAFRAGDCFASLAMTVFVRQ
jgi:hypothetical protein